MRRALVCFIVLVCLPLSTASAAPLRTPLSESATATPSIEISGQSHYGSLISLLGDLGTEAAGSFAGFFDSSPVRVRPFVHLGAMNHDSSLLGVILADQMTAMLNSHANAFADSESGEGQLLEGSFQEVDGHLRIHILATNGRQERRSHLAVIEMSTALHRILHSHPGGR